MGEAVLRYESYLEVARDYLTNRGITHRTATEFRLGVVHDPYPGHQGWAGRLALPYLAADGSVHNLKARRMVEDDSPKYLGEANIEPSLFNVKALLSDADTLWICEGEFDAMILHQMGLATVAYAGTNAWRSVFNRAVGPDWAGINVIADGDTPGIEAAKRVAKEIHGQVVELPSGEDVSSLYVARGEQWLKNYLGVESDAEAIPY